MVKLYLVLMLLVVESLGVFGQDLPSCLAETEAYCLNDGADLSGEGIDKCLRSDQSRLSLLCQSFLAVTDACKNELSAAGACGKDALEGDGIVCLLSRVDKSLLSEECKDSFPEQKEATGLRETFWKNGKKELAEEQIESLTAEEKDIYTRWVERKGRTSPRDKDREYALKHKKVGKAVDMMVFDATQKIKHLIADEDTNSKEIRKIVSKTIKEKYAKLKEKDPTLSISKSELKELEKQAIKQAKKDLKLKSKKEL